MRTFGARPSLLLSLTLFLVTLSETLRTFGLTFFAEASLSLFLVSLSKVLVTVVVDDVVVVSEFFTTFSDASNHT